MEQHIELGNGLKPSLIWTYQLFKMGGAETNYRLTIGEGQGVGGTYDPMAYHNGKSFTTLDHDNDLNPANNCSITIINTKSIVSFAYKVAIWLHSHPLLLLL